MTECHAEMSLGPLRPEKPPNGSAFLRKTEEMAERIRVLLISCEMLRENSGNGLAERVRVGVFQLASRNTNKDGAFSLKPHDRSDLASSDPFVGFRLFASVCEFCQRNDTRNDTRENVLREDLRGCCTRAAVRIRRRTDADLRFKREGISGTLNGNPAATIHARRPRRAQLDRTLRRQE
jgi:hypothetical protein